MMVWQLSADALTTHAIGMQDDCLHEAIITAGDENGEKKKEKEINTCG